MKNESIRDLMLFLLWIFFYIILSFFIVPSCGHDNGHSTSYESVEEVRDYGRAIYYEGRWQ